MFQELYQSPEINIEQKHMKDVENGNRQWSIGKRGSRGRNKLEEKSGQPNNKQTNSLTGEEKKLVKCCVFKNYSLKLPAVLSSSKSDYIYWKKDTKCMCYFNFQMKRRFMKLQPTNVHGIIHMRSGPIREFL